MDLIYMNPDMEDVGVLKGFEIDLAFGEDENDLECKILRSAHCCEAGWFLYMEGTEYGGIIDGIEVDSEDETIIYKGRTWHGILNSKIILPDADSDVRTLTGDATDVVNTLLADLALADLFEVAGVASDLLLEGYELDGYTPAYDAIKKMLESVGGKLLFRFNGSKVGLTVKAIKDYSADDEFDTDLVAFRFQKNYNTVNHLICVWGKEDEEKTVFHLYADADGNISNEQTLVGLAEVVAVQKTSAEDLEAAEKECTDAFKDLQEQAEMEFSLNDDSDSYDVGDKIGAHDSITGISEVAIIRKKIIKLTDANVSIEYELGR